MTAIAIPRNNESDFNFNWGKILWPIILVAIIVVCAHAYIQHGSIVDIVNRCMDEKGPMLKWHQPNGRELWICWVDELNKFGGQVREADGDDTDIVTAFVNKSKTLERLYRWLHDTKGYKLFYDQTGTLPLDVP